MFTHLVALFSSIPFFFFLETIISKNCPKNNTSIMYLVVIIFTIFVLYNPIKSRIQQQDYYLPIDANFSYHANDIHIQHLSPVKISKVQCLLKYQRWQGHLPAFDCVHLILCPISMQMTSIFSIVYQSKFVKISKV